jgi:hypothetical protein
MFPVPMFSQSDFDTSPTEKWGPADVTQDEAALWKVIQLLFGSLHVFTLAALHPTVGKPRQLCSPTWSTHTSVLQWSPLLRPQLLAIFSLQACEWVSVPGSTAPPIQLPPASESPQLRLHTLWSWDEPLVLSSFWIFIHRIYEHQKMLVSVTVFGMICYTAEVTKTASMLVKSLILSEHFFSSYGQ